MTNISPHGVLRHSFEAPTMNAQNSVTNSGINSKNGQKTKVMKKEAD